MNKFEILMKYLSGVYNFALDGRVVNCLNDCACQVLTGMSSSDIYYMFTEAEFNNVKHKFARGFNIIRYEGIVIAYEKKDLRYDLLCKWLQNNGLIRDKSDIERIGKDLYKISNRETYYHVMTFDEYNANRAVAQVRGAGNVVQLSDLFVVLY